MRLYMDTDDETAVRLDKLRSTYPHLDLCPARHNPRFMRGIY